MLLAVSGKRVGVLDFDLQSPGMQILFGLRDYAIEHYVNDALSGACDIVETAIPLHEHLDPTPEGQLFVCPANPDPSAVAASAQQDKPPSLLQETIYTLRDGLKLDMLLVDNHAGIHQTSLSAMSTADRVVILFRIDHQDHQGTAVMVDLAHNLDLDEGTIKLVANEVPGSVDVQSVLRDAFDTFDAPVIGVLPHTEDLQALGSREIFSEAYPDHPVTVSIKQIAAQLW
jgi:MinD-like ATPase involved in chromosome partitioning or flagellar assembly